MADTLAPPPEPTDAEDTPQVNASETSIARVSAKQIGVTAAVFERGISLTSLCRLTYPGGKDIEDLWNHVHNRDEYAQDTPNAIAKDVSRLETAMAEYNQGKPENHCLKADLFRAKKLQAVIYHNDHEIIVTFEGSDGLEFWHYVRNLFKSPIILQPNLFFHDDWRRGHWDDYEQKIDRLASRVANPGENIEKIKDNLKKAKVHKGWWDSLNLPLKFGPGQEEGDTLWMGMERQIAKLEEEIIARTGKSPKLTFAGHSSGGSLSLIAAARWMENHDKMVDEIYTFGSPRTGNREFRRSMYEFMDEGGLAKIYRFEMEGDPVPSLPPLWSFTNSHLRPCGSLIGIATNGNLIAVKHRGKIVTAEQSATDAYEKFSLYYQFRNRIQSPLGRLINISGKIATGTVGIAGDAAGHLRRALFDDQVHANGFVTAPDHQLEGMWSKRGGKGWVGKMGTDPGLANMPKTLLDFGSHIVGHSAYRHVLPTMQEALKRQLRMEKIREVQGGCIEAEPLAHMLERLVESLKQAQADGKLADIEDSAALIALVDTDKVAFVRAEIAARGKPLPTKRLGPNDPVIPADLARAAACLANARSDDPNITPRKMCEPASLVTLVHALAGHDALKDLYRDAKHTLHQAEYFLAQNAPVKLDRKGVKFQRQYGYHGNGNGNGHHHNNHGR